MNSFTVSSPAKVNLFLKVLKKRPDGYHDIVTLFHRISLADTIQLKKIPSGIQIRSNIPSLPVDSKNIIWKAYDLARKEIPSLKGVSVTIKKQIPIGAGLGGGSSNAAYFLRGLARLYQLRIPNKKMAEWGAKLGADVSFFLHDVNQAIGYGTGCLIRPLPCLKTLWFVLVAMPKPLLTSKVYQNYHGKPQDAFLTKENRVDRLVTGFFQDGNVIKALPYMQNDLEKPCVRLYPEVGKVLQFFDRCDVLIKLVSGSGATAFAVVSSKTEAVSIASMARKKLGSCCRQVVIAHTV